MKYDKLVRDKVPRIIEASGNKPKCRIAKGEELGRYIGRKFSEETAEFMRADSKAEAAEELADIVEVVLAACDHIGVTVQEVMRLRDKKFGEKGGFSKGIILEEVE